MYQFANTDQTQHIFTDLLFCALQYLSTAIYVLTYGFCKVTESTWLHEEALNYVVIFKMLVWNIVKVYYYNYVTVPELFLIMSYHKVLIRRKFLKYIPIRPKPK